MDDASNAGVRREKKNQNKTKQNWRKCMFIYNGAFGAMAAATAALVTLRLTYKIQLLFFLPSIGLSIAFFCAVAVIYSTSWKLLHSANKLYCILCMEWSVSMPMHVLRMYIWAAKIKKEFIEHRDREREISFESQFSYMSYSKSWAHSEYYLCPLSFAYCMHQLPVYEVDRYLRTSYTKCMDILCDATLCWAILAGRRNQEDFIERTIWKVVMKVFPTLLNLFRMPWLSLTQCIIEKWKREPHGVWGCTMCVCVRCMGKRTNQKPKRVRFFSMLHKCRNNA